MDPQKIPTPNGAMPPSDADDKPVDGSAPATTPEAGSTIKPSTDAAAPVSDEASTASQAPLPPLDSSDTPADAPEASADAGLNVPASPLPVTPSRGRKKLWVIGVIIGIVLLLLGAGAAAAYYYTMNKPENVLSQALANALDQEKNKTMHFSGALKVDDVESTLGLEATYTGAVDSSGALDISAKLDVLLATMTFDLRSTDGKTFYFKLGGIKGLPELFAASSDPLLGGPDAQWIALYSGLLTAVDEQWLEINESLIEQAAGGEATPEKLNPDDTKKLVDAYKQHTFLVVKETLPDEAIKNVASYHYKIGIDKAKLKEFMAALKAANIKSLKITQEQLDELTAEIDKNYKEGETFELWIAKKTKIINQLAIKTTTEGDRIEFRFTVDSYNQSVKVEKPAGAKSILEIMSEALAPTSSDLMMNGFSSGISL